jgi:hypothetical protein
MKHQKFLLQIFLLLLVFMSATFVLGQAVNYAEIQGRILDPTGATIPGAKVDATNVDTGLVRSVTSNGDGAYTLPNLPVGHYKLDVSAAGFKEYIQNGIILQVNESPTINVSLQVGAVSEKMEVTSNAVMVDTHENSVSTVIDNNRIMELPLDGRNAPALILLSGGAANVALSGNDLNSSKNYGNGNSANSSPTVTISVGGSQENSNNYLLDGSDNNDAFSNVNAPFPFPDAIQEFSVQSSGLSARYGVHAGAVVNMVTKSGTNNLHGDIFEYIRNPLLNAHHVFFTPPAPGSHDDTVKRNQFGGTLGGPLIKDKVMFFVGYQGTRQDSSPPPKSTIVPTAAALAGDFSTMMSAGCQSSGKAKTLKAPFTANVTSPTNFTAQSLALLKFVPIATNPCGNISFTIPGILNEDQGIARVDWNVSSRNTIFARYFATDYRAPVPFDPTDILPQGQTASQFSRYQTLALGNTFTFNSGLVNAFHLTGTRMAINRGPASNMINPATIGVNVPTPVPNGMVLSISSGYFTTGGGSQMPGHFDNNLFQVADDIDMLRGRQQISFGVNFMKMQLNYLSTFQSNGQFTFGGAFSGDNLADFMLGTPSTYVQGNPEAENWRYTYFGLYVHDNVKVKQNLTLNAGVRWEPYFPSWDALHRGSHFDYNNFINNVHSTIFPNAPAGLTYCGDPGTPCSFANNKLLDFSPRVGLIWDPTNKGTFTVRAGYGLFYDSPEMYFFDRYADNSPYGSAVSLTKPAGGFANPYLGQTTPPFPTPFPTPGSFTFFPTNGVYINNGFDMHPMYVQNWNMSIEKQFGNDWMVSATYIGNKTTHIWAAYEQNPGLDVPVPANALPGCTPGQAPSTSNTNCRRALYIANPSVGQFFSNMTAAWDGANANYNGMLLATRHRMSNNFTLLANYTWSHCISDADFSGELTNSRPTLYPSAINNPDFGNLDLDRGNCGFDVRQSINSSLVINSPHINGGFAGALLNNWQFAPLITYRTGLYFTVLTGADTALTGETTSFRDRPNQVGDPLSGSCANGAAVGTRNCWFNTAAFTVPTSGTFGDVGRDSISGPGAFQFDAAISRRFAVTEAKEIQLRFEAFNVLNHPNLGNPNSSENSATFGEIQSQVGDGRTFQGAFKFLF